MQNRRRSWLAPAAAPVLAATLSLPDAALAFSVFKVDPGCVDRGAYATIQEAIDAAAGNSGIDYVWIANTTSYSGQHVVIADPDGVIVEGGFADCDDFDPGADSTLINGTGNGGLPVFNIVGPSNVSLSHLSVAFASRASDTGGGGIAFTGDGSVTLAATSIFLNNAGYGAGISVTASGGNAQLVLNDDVVVTNNTAAHSGGGIRLEGDTRLIVLGTGTSIVNNVAEDYGGGIEILGPARADIGALGGGGGPAINHNSANYGGGVAVLDNGNGEAVLRTFAYDSAHPTTFNQNTASLHGGAIYLAGLADACLFSPRLTNDIAEDGAAIYYTAFVADGSGDYVNDGGIYINAPPSRLGSECGPETVAALGGTKDCNASSCNLITGHATRHADNTPSSGAVLFTDRNDFIATRLRIQGNTAGRLMRVYYHTEVSRCLLTDNSVSDVLLYVDGFPSTFRSCTIANNTIGGGYIFDIQDGTLDFVYDIFDQPGKPLVTKIIGTWTAEYTMAAEAGQLPTGTNPGDIQGRPTFVDAANGNYHLRASSKGVDFAPKLTDVDLDGQPGGVDIPQVPDRFVPSSPSDLGAYELQSAFACDTASDVVYCDGFDG